MVRLSNISEEKTKTEENLVFPQDQNKFELRILEQRIVEDQVLPFPPDDTIISILNYVTLIVAWVLMIIEGREFQKYPILLIYYSVDFLL